MENVYIIGGLRSHIGVKNGVFKHVLPEKLGAHVLKELIKKYNISNIDEIICGNALGCGGNIARLLSLYADVPQNVPAYTVDMQCSSGSAVIDVAYSKIKSGKCDLIICGGVESSSLQPLRYYNKNDPRYSIDKQYYMNAQFSPYETEETSMFKGAERVAEKYSMTKDEINSWIIKSHQKATIARDNHKLKNIICSCFGSAKDEAIRDNMNMRLINRLKPILDDGKFINAASSTLTNDSAAFIILASEKYIEENNYTPKAKIINTLLCANDPLYSPEGAISGIEKLLTMEKMNYDEISAYEINEAFAVIDVLFQRKNPNLCSKLNMFGGALAYGHPFAASGIVIMLHLLEILEDINGKYGITSIAGAGGMGTSILVERR